MKNKGFTFIEVLVVTTIIAVLMTVGVTSFRVANQKARDGRRKTDLEQIRSALELYRTDQGIYPLTTAWPGAGETLEADGVTYMEEIPGDPTEGYYYVYSSAAGLSYRVAAYLEIAGSDESSLTGCSSEPGDCNYQVKNPL